MKDRSNKEFCIATYRVFSLYEKLEIDFFFYFNIIFCPVRKSTRLYFLFFKSKVEDARTNVRLAVSLSGWYKDLHYILCAFVH